MQLVTPSNSDRPRKFPTMYSLLFSHPMPQWASIIAAGLGSLVLLVLIATA